MRTLIGRTPVALARRWLRAERLAQLTLRRDAYADTPGPSVTLHVGERTTYRAGAWLLDAFDRLQLGASYPPWGGTIGLALVAGRVRPVGFGVPGMVTHTRPLPRDAWAAVEIAALSGPTAVVGVLLQASADAAYRITATSAGATVIERFDAGTPTALATVPTPWRAGDVLRVELLWNRLRVYREPILVAELLDAGLPLAGRAAGLVAGRADPTDDAALGAFVAGEARQEYLGAGLDLGDVQVVLGEPVRFDVTLSNTAPLGGKDRFAALLRHGQNTAGTYDLDRGEARVLTVVEDGTAPLTAAVGVIDAPGALSEDRVRIQCRGRDAFLTPQLAAGVVTYLAGPPPGGLTPLPPDPCAPAAPPTIIPGPLPAEPVDPPGDEGIGPEAPDEPPAADPPPPPLNGQYLVTFGYAGFGHDGQEIVYGTDVTAYENVDPLDPDAGGLPPGRGSVPVWDRRQLERDPDNGDEQDGQPPKDLNDPPPWTPGQPIPAGQGMWINTFTDEHGVEYTTNTPCVCGACDSPGEIAPPAGHTYLGSCFAGGCGAGPSVGTRCDPDATTLVGPRRASSPAAPRATESRPYARHYRWLYRGPDVPGTHLSRDPDDDSTQALLFEEWWTIAPLDYDNSAGTYATLEIKLARYDASGIHTVGDLAAISPLAPPDRIETLATWSINGTTLTAKTMSVFLAKALTLVALPLNQFTGPQLIGIELPATGWSRGAIPRSEVAVWPHVNGATRLLKIVAL